MWKCTDMCVHVLAVLKISHNPLNQKKHKNIAIVFGHLFSKCIEYRCLKCLGDCCISIYVNKCVDGLFDGIGYIFKHIYDCFRGCISGFTKNKQERINSVSIQSRSTTTSNIMNSKLSVPEQVREETPVSVFVDNSEMCE